MNVQEILAQIDHAITEIDLVLHQWQEDLDMMSFIGVNATFELWTNDHPPRIVTKDLLSQAAGKELRVMHHIDGAWTKVGIAHVDERGMLTAQIDRDIPELQVGLRNYFSIDYTEKWNPLPSERAFEPKLPDRIPFKWTPHIEEWQINFDRWGAISSDALIEHYKNHPFFKES